MERKLIITGVVIFFVVVIVIIIADKIIDKGQGYIDSSQVLSEQSKGKWECPKGCIDGRFMDAPTGCVYKKTYRPCKKVWVPTTECERLNCESQGMICSGCDCRYPPENIFHPTCAPDEPYYNDKKQVFCAPSDWRGCGP